MASMEEKAIQDLFAEMRIADAASVGVLSEEDIIEIFDRLGLEVFNAEMLKGLLFIR